MASRRLAASRSKALPSSASSSEPWARVRVSRSPWTMWAAAWAMARRELEIQWAAALLRTHRSRQGQERGREEQLAELADDLVHIRQGQGHSHGAFDRARPSL